MSSFFVLFGLQDRVDIRQDGVWIDFLISPFISPICLILLEFFRQTQFQLSELWNIPQFQCFHILKTPCPMWDSLKPEWNLIRIV